MPISSPAQTTVYTLTIHSPDGCAAMDFVKVTVLANLSIPNIITQNDDGVNDTWVINNLDHYTGCTFQIFTRLGREIYNSIGYSKARDGTLNGKPLHLGVYYYVINLHNNTPPVSGFVVIIFNAEWPLASQAVGYWRKNKSPLMFHFLIAGSELRYSWCILYNMALSVNIALWAIFFQSWSI
jgi:gliding motility-associated-like protein